MLLPTKRLRFKLALLAFAFRRHRQKKGTSILDTVTACKNCHNEAVDPFILTRMWTRTILLFYRFIWVINSLNYCIDAIYKYTDIKTIFYLICKSTVKISKPTTTLSALFGCQVTLEIQTILYTRKGYCIELPRPHTLEHSSPKTQQRISFMAGLPNRISKLQHIQNNATYFVRLDSSVQFTIQFAILENIIECNASLLHDLHWIPMGKHIIYKEASLMFQCLNNSTFHSCFRQSLTKSASDICDLYLKIKTFILKRFFFMLKHLQRLTFEPRTTSPGI